MNLPSLPQIVGLTPDQVGTLSSSVKSYPQFVTTVEKLRAGKCLFCDPFDTELNKIIKVVGEGTPYTWRLWHNPYPIKGKDSSGKRIVAAEKHVIWAPVRHLVDANDLTDEDWNNKSILERHVFTKGDGTGLNIIGGLLMRIGPSSHNQKSVTHLHGNGIMPNLKAEVRPPLAKDPREMMEDYAILIVFAKMIGGTSFEDLAPDEKVLVEDRMTAV